MFQNVHVSELSSILPQINKVITYKKDDLLLSQDQEYGVTTEPAYEESKEKEKG